VEILPCSECLFLADKLSEEELCSFAFVPGQCLSERSRHVIGLVEYPGPQDVELLPHVNTFVELVDVFSVYLD